MNTNMPAVALANGHSFVWQTDFSLFSTRSTATDILNFNFLNVISGHRFCHNLHAHTKIYICWQLLVIIILTCCE